jgi:paraquat-inducible protein B
MPDQPLPLPPLPESRRVAKSKTRLSLVWIVPIVAALVGVWVAVAKIMSEGPTITIVFQTAQGLEAGKTKILYEGVDVGTVMTIRLSDDHRRVITTAKMAPKTEGFLLDDTRFWVVRPRISGGNVSGLGTLISGAYIGMDIGTSERSKRDFVALETPPAVTADVAGRFFTLKTPDLGSLDNGTPIYFRRLHVGKVASYELDKDGKAMTVRVFVTAPYDQYVNPNTRFWHASGVDVSLSANGISVQTQSLLSILVGGIAFETPATDPVLPPAEADAVFPIFSGRTDAFKLPSRDPQTFVVVFKQSLRGLAPGAPVEFQGIPIGEVTSIQAQVDAETMEFSAPVTIRLDATRLGVKVVDLPLGETLDTARRKFMDAMIARGVRAQLRSGSLLTGALFVAFDVFPDAPPVTVDWSQQPVHLPTIAGELAAIEARAASIVKKIDEMPLKQIGDDLRNVLADLDRTLQSVHRTVDNADKLVEPNSVLGAELGNTLQEVTRAARALRGLADYLERHPEALIRGKAGKAEQ